MRILRVSPVGAALGAALVSVVLSGCTASAGLQPTNSGAVDDVPGFAGPYAAEYAAAWQETESDFVRSVLVDERVSDQEWSEVTVRLAQCLEQRGISFLEFDDDGGYSVQINGAGHEEALEAADECEVTSGERWLGYLRRGAIVNPENVDPADAISACLVRLGAIAPGYGAEDYRADVESRSFPYLDPETGDGALRECSLDPSTTRE